MRPRALADRVDSADRKPSPNRSRASSDMSRRETRLRAVSVTTAACKPGPNGEPATPSGSPAAVCACHSLGSATGACGARRRSPRSAAAPRPDGGRNACAAGASRLAELVPAAATSIRVVIDELVDLILAAAARDPTPGCPGWAPGLRSHPRAWPTPSPSRAPPPAARPASSEDPARAGSNELRESLRARSSKTPDPLLQLRHLAAQPAQPTRQELNARSRPAS